jgi:predicted small metal-binding protein
MTKIACQDYGFECDFISQGNDVDKVISEYATHSTQEHGIEYSKGALIQILNRMKR